MKVLHRVINFLTRVFPFSLRSACYRTAVTAVSLLCVDSVIANVVNDSDSISRFTELNEVTVSPHKNRYSKKNNPAVELINNVRRSAKLSNPLNQSYYSFNKYSKFAVGIDRVGFAARPDSRYSFLSEYVDTLLSSGDPLLKVAVKENVSKFISSRKPYAKKEIIYGRRNEGIDESFNNENIYATLEELLREVDIYDDEIPLLKNRFISPLSSLGPDVYKYFITDSTRVDNNKITKIAFYPQTLNAYGFSGIMNVAEHDSVLFVKDIILRVPSTVNLNYVDNLTIKQSFELDSIGSRRKKEDLMSASLSLVDGGVQFITERSTGYSGFSYNKEDDFSAFYSRLGNKFYLEDIDKRNDDFWNEQRMFPLSNAEQRLSSLITRLRRIPTFRWGERIFKIIVEGYVPTPKNSKVDIGPVTTLLSYNSLEGMRFRLGGVTTTALSSHWFANGYIAYGLRDKKLKYKLGVEYSFNRKRITSTEFPINSISLFHQYDVHPIGGNADVSNQDYFFLSFRRKKSDLATYRRVTSLTYTYEFLNNLSLSTSLQLERQESSPFVHFINGRGNSFNHYNQSSLKLTVRYAPGETYLFTRAGRIPVNHEAPIIELSQEIGPKNWFGSCYYLNKTEVSLFKQIRFPLFGYADIYLKGGILWSKVQFPALLWPSVNLSYTVSPESYSLMNMMEFANDKYASINITYFMKGYLINLIPYIRKTHLRELITFKALWGGLSKRNNPDLNSDLFQFPLNNETYTMKGAKPYMEIGVGLDNIFSVLRLDYIWRLSYLNHPGINKSGLRVSLHFSF